MLNPSTRYEHSKHDGNLPLIGENTFLGGKKAMRFMSWVGCIAGIGISRLRDLEFDHAA
ncbi:MAG: hypothetical protein HKP21_08795 [Xanthomonadales bacterium]|nr:hypothetical protein [Gammaproteobacteria bacterium]NNK04638.1 hypothetical protein [Xanthomonadales bacterium]